MFTHDCETARLLDQDVSETPFERQLADRLEGLVPNRRKEPRNLPENKVVRMTAELDVQVRDESQCGMCLRVPRATHVEIDQEICVADGNRRRKGVVRWVRRGDSPNTKFVGFEWSDDAKSWTGTTPDPWDEKSRFSGGRS